MHAARVGFSATRLRNGKVLVEGGASNTVGGLASAELYDPATRSWRLTGTLISGRARHNATLLDDGRVLVSGGWYNGEVYSLATGAWTSTGNMVNWYRNASVAALLPDGRVLVAGGEYEDCSDGWEYCYFVFVSTAEIFSP
jgi:N-acetylneuraminic acid mutarotase